LSLTINVRSPLAIAPPRALAATTRTALPVLAERTCVEIVSSPRWIVERAIPVTSETTAGIP
jgi:hypothetical protein